MKKFFADFKAFALKGNILDMAVGVIIGGAFGKIVTSLVGDIITPLISMLTGRVSLVDLKAVLVAADEAQGIGEIAITYGNFLQAIIDFLIIALSIFVVLRIMMKGKEKLESLKKKEDEVKAEEEAPAETELSVLKEIKEMLSKEKGQD